MIPTIEIKSGWAAAYTREHIVLTRPEGPPQRIRLDRLQNGDSVPYDETDKSPDVIPLSHVPLEIPRPKL